MHCFVGNSRTTVMFPECDSYAEDQQMEVEEYIRLTPLDSNATRNNNQNEMLRFMKITYQSRLKITNFSGV